MISHLTTCHGNLLARRRASPAEQRRLRRPARLDGPHLATRRRSAHAPVRPHRSDVAAAAASRPRVGADAPEGSREFLVARWLLGGASARRAADEWLDRAQG